MLSTKRLDELEVLSLSAGLDENAEVSLTLVECLRALAETTCKTVMDKGVLQNLLLDSVVGFFRSEKLGDLT